MTNHRFSVGDSSELAIKADLKDLELRLVEKINAVRDRIDAVRDRVDAVGDRILWAVIGIGIITWLLQVFGNSIRHLLGVL
jgi:hypothetical protein